MATPVVFLLLLGIVQLAVVIGDQLAVIEASRIGARTAAVAVDPASAGGSAGQHALSRPGRVDTVVRDGIVTVTVTVVSHTDVPLIGALLPDVEVEASASMILEPP